MGVSPWTERHARREQRRELARRQAPWLVGALAAMVAAARLSTRSLDPPTPEVVDWVLTLVHALEFQVGIVVAALGIGAGLRRQWWPAGGAAIVVVATVAWPLVDGRLARADHRSTSRSDLRVLSINSLVWNVDLTGTARTIRNSDPDVVLVQEWGPRHERRLVDLLDPEWSLVAGEVRDDSFGTAALVRTSLRDDVDATVWYLEPGTTPQVRLELAHEGANVVLYGVHLVPPTSPAQAAIALDEVRELRRRVAREDDPIVVAGDFNAVGGSSIDRAMQRADLRDAWSLHGAGPGWTWPRNGPLRWLPGVRIDHAYVGAGVRTRGVELLDAGASDHRPLLVTIDVDRATRAD